MWVEVLRGSLHWPPGLGLKTKLHIEGEPHEAGHELLRKEQFPRSDKEILRAPGAFSSDPGRLGRDHTRVLSALE